MLVLHSRCALPACGSRLLSRPLLYEGLHRACILRVSQCSGCNNAGACSPRPLMPAYQMLGANCMCMCVGGRRVARQERRVRDIAQGQRGVRGSRHRVHPDGGWAGHLLAWRQVGLQPQPVSRQLGTPRVAHACAQSYPVFMNQICGFSGNWRSTGRHSRWHTSLSLSHRTCTGARHPKTRPTGRPRRR